MNRIVSSPLVLLATIWCFILVAVAVGPIDYATQPSLAVLCLVGAGTLLFMGAYQGGAWAFAFSGADRSDRSPPSARLLNTVAALISIAGICGIGLIALDRLVLSGVGGAQYAELLRCAPDLVDLIEVKRTPALYFGYLFFSFGYVSLALLVLKAEEIRGWAAVLTQLSVVCPIGYALLYSGRMPILLLIAMIVSAMLVRYRQGRKMFPTRHRLLLKLVIVFVLFAAYSMAMWSTRQAYCLQASSLIGELQKRMRDSNTLSSGVGKVEGVEFGRMAAQIKPGVVIETAKVGETLAAMKQSWHVTPRGYVMMAIDSGWLSPSAARSLLNTYFYLTHGVRIIDVTWRERELFTPHWGVYEIGVLSPVLRVFYPQSDALSRMSTQLNAAEIKGFFPTIWAAAFIDFGLVGAVIYALIWGAVAGWSAAGSRTSTLVTPQLLLAFILASIFLSPIQAPLGIANSALVLLAVLATGLVLDITSRKMDREQV